MFCKLKILIAKKFAQTIILHTAVHIMTNLMIFFPNFQENLKNTAVYNFFVPSHS